MENQKNLTAVTTLPECTLKELSTNLKTQHLMPARTGAYFQVSNIQLKDEVMLSIWEFMINLYGDKWIGQFGEFYDEDGHVKAAPNHWAQALSRVPLKAIDRGMMKCIQERQSPFPPTLPEFYQLCERMPWE